MSEFVLKGEWGHDALAADLASHLRGGSQRVTWLDMQLGPVGSPRPDVYSMEPTYTRLTFEAFECKVSRADYRSDVTSGKWQKYLKYANKVTFAVPAGMINKTEVPDTCGLIVRHEGGWRYAKKPTSHVLTDIPWQAWLKLLLDGVERAQHVGRSVHFNQYVAEKVLSKKFGDTTAQLITKINELPQLYEGKKAAEEARLGVLRKCIDDENRRLQEARAAARERCDGSLQRLAKILGLPDDASVTDLQERAARLSNFMAEDPNHWRQGQMTDMAKRLEVLAADIRLVFNTPKDPAAA